MGTSFSGHLASRHIWWITEVLVFCTTRDISNIFDFCWGARRVGKLSKPQARTLRSRSSANYGSALRSRWIIKAWGFPCGRIRQTFWKNLPELRFLPCSTQTNAHRNMVLFSICWPGRNPSAQNFAGTLSEELLRKDRTAAWPFSDV